MTKVKRLIIMMTVFLSPIIILWYFTASPIFSDNPSEYTEIVSAENLKSHVIKLSVELPKRTDDVDKLNVSAEYIYNELQKYTNNVEFQYFNVWGIDYRNVVARFGPERSKQPVTIVGAHYDVFGGFPGADDNASGVAGLIELSRILSAVKLTKPIELVAYALEEPPYFRTEDMGSFQHAKKLFESSRQVELMISLEMIGYFSDAEESQTYPIKILDLLYPSKGNFIGIVGRYNDFNAARHLKRLMSSATPLAVYSINTMPFLPGVDYSDHRSYWHFGYPALMITDTAFYRNEEYHSENDTWNRLDYEKMAMVIHGVFFTLTQTNS